MALTDNLISHWKLDESSGNAADSVGSNTLVNSGITYSTGKLGNGAVSNADTDKLAIVDNASLSITGALSISTWVKFDSIPTGTNYALFLAKWTPAGNQRSYQAYLYGDGNIYFDTCVDGSTGNSQTYAWVPSTGVWYHLAFTYTPSTNTKIYINGVLVSTDTTGIPASLYDSTADLVLFGDGAVAGRLTEDEVSLWSRAITADEVSQIFNSNRANAYPFTATPSLYGAVSYYKLDESSGNAVDSVGGNTLTNNNSTPFVAGKINNGVTTASLGSKYMSVAANPLSVTGDLSISFWVNFNTLPGNNLYVGLVTKKLATNPWNQGYAFYFSNNSGVYNINTEVANTSATTIATVWTPSLDTWYYLTWTYSATAHSSIVYVNGSVLATVDQVQTAIGTTTDALDVGAYTAGSFANATFDEVGIWSRALTGAEVTSLYNAGAGNQYPFLTNWTQSLSTSVAFTESRISRAGINKTTTFTFAESKTSQTGINKTAAFSFIEASAKNVGKSTTDSMSMFEDAAQIPAFQRNPSESFSFLESKTTFSEFQRTFSDNLIFAESLSKQSGKTLSDSLSIIELIAEISEYQRALSDSLTISEVLSKIVPFQRMISETILIIESLQKHTDLSFSSALNLVESILTQSEYSRSLAENLNLAESLLKLAEFKLDFSVIISIAENLSKNTDMTFSIALQLLESFSKTSEFNLQNIDTLSLAELISKQTGKPLADIVSILDAVPLVERGLVTSATDSVSITDQFRKDIGINFSNNLTISESKTALIDFIRTFSDSVQITESLAKQMGLTLQELTVLAENIIKITELHKSETIILLESKVQSVGLQKTDTLSFSDAFQKEALKQNVDSFQLSEASSHSSILAVTDSFIFQDLLKYDTTKKIVDLLAISESITKAINIPKNEILFITENAAKSTSRPISDTVSISESHQISYEYAVHIIDSVALFEVLIKDFGLSISDASVLTAVISLNDMSAFATQRTTVLTSIQGRTVLLARS